MVVINDQHLQRWLVKRNAQDQRENIVMVGKQLFPRKEQKVAGEVDEKGTSRINPKDMPVIVWVEQSMKATMELCIATVNLNLASHIELM